MLAYRLIRDTLYRHAIASVSTLGLLASSRALQACIPLLFAALVSQFDATDASDIVFWLLAGYVLASLSVVVTDEVRQILFLPLIQRVQRQFMVQALAALHAKTNGFHSRHASPRLTQMLTRAAWSLESLGSVGLFNLVPNALYCLIAAIVLGWSLGPAFAGILVGTLTIYVRFTVHIAGTQKQLYAKRIQADNQVHAMIGDSLANHEVVQQFENSQSESQRLLTRQHLLHQHWREQQQHLSRSKMIQSLIVHSGLGLMLFLTVKDMQNGHASVADLVMVNMYMLQVFAPLQAVGLLYTAFIQARTDIQSLEALELKFPTPEPGVPAPSRSISISKVSVYSDEGERLLNDVSLDVTAGSTVAIVGQSGAGKSVLMKVLAGVIEPAQGHLCYDGNPVSARGRMQQTLYVSQRTGIFDDTLEYNIRFAAPDCSEDELAAALSSCQLDSVMAQHDAGLNSPCGEGGSLLSGGERQRVALARAWLSNKPIQILDEATSQLDRINESAILKRFRERPNGETRFIITHRLDSIIDADRIVLMEKGRVVAQGSHSHLMNHAPLYRQLHEAASTSSRNRGNENER
ncbi:ATP-binding cassette domain-containing protein [Alcanivorax sediminis]|uniref:ATP-binding cassette domain-containing protein n=1 Tax=Alcanivorax sediminis TaxID=2663008 RepID=A0A6N7LQ80_9GAMM|nr:ABC transporter ATP-binding protein [Alcanivorax sediminis]MQX52419.1 ATP-binding cassette domain-containing protein [Alcanivorax sediminis]